MRLKKSSLSERAEGIVTSSGRVVKQIDILDSRTRIVRYTDGSADRLPVSRAVSLLRESKSNEAVERAKKSIRQLQDGQCSVRLSGERKRFASVSAAKAAVTRHYVSASRS